MAASRVLGMVPTESWVVEHGFVIVTEKVGELEQIWPEAAVMQD